MIGTFTGNVKNIYVLTNNRLEELFSANTNYTIEKYSYIIVDGNSISPSFQGGITEIAFNLVIKTSVIPYAADAYTALYFITDDFSLSFN